MNLNQMSDSDLRDMCETDITFIKGKHYYEQQNVKSIHINKLTGSYKADVSGSRRYTVFIETTELMDIESMNCSCPAFKKYSGPCKHIVSVLMAIQRRDRSSEEEKGHGELTIKEEKHEPVNDLSNERTGELINAFEQLYVKKQETYHEREPLDVHYTIRLSSTFSQRHRGTIEVEMKAGPERLYVVKDIHEFLTAVEHNKALKFSKKFTYHPADYFFHEADLDIFRLMTKIAETQTDVSPFYNFRGNTSSQKRKFSLPPSYAVQFLGMLKERAVTVDDGLMPVEGFEVSSSKPGFRFHLIPDPGRSGIYKLLMDGTDHISYFGRKFGLVYSSGFFCHLKGENLDAFDALFFQLILEEPAELLLDKAQLETFASVVLPRLNDLGHVSLSPLIEDQIRMAPLVPYLYADFTDDGRITAEVVFQYGDVKLSPFDRHEPQQDRLIVRDMEKEYYLLSFVEDIPFKFNGSELYLDQQEDMLDFVAEQMPKLSELFHMYASSKVRSLIHRPAEAPSVKVDTDETLNLLDIEFDIGGISAEELEDVLKSLLAEKKYYRLSSGSFIHLESDAMQSMKHMMGELEMTMGDTSGGRISQPLYRAFQLADTQGLQVKKDKAFKKLVERLTEPEELDFTVPEHLTGVMRDYQKRGFQWLMSLRYYGFGGVLADDMGLGKTLQTIACFYAGKENGSMTEPALVICPSSVVYNWQKEIEKFAPGLSSAVITGTAAERQAAMAEAETCDVWITSYPLIRRDVSSYQNRMFSTMVLDEAQYVKNQGTLTAKAVRLVSCRHSFALSGTPIENSLDELYSIFSIVQPGLFKTKQAYKNMAEERIARRVKPFVLRRMKQDVLTELPDKIESVQYTHLTDEQKVVYYGQLQLLQSQANEAIKTEKFQENRMKLLAGLTRLRQICCHPGMFMSRYEGDSGKLERLMEFLREAREAGSRIVLFSQFTKMLAIIKERLHDEDWDYHYLDGATPGSERVELAERFNSGEKNLFLVSLKAGGTGLNLTGGDTVILFDSWWNPAVEEQAADRVYRFGQKQVVQVTKMITTGTIEEKIHKLQEKKRDLLDRVIQPGETSFSSLGKEDIEELLDLRR